MPSPEIERAGDSWVLTWPEHAIGVSVDKVREGRENALTAEVIVNSTRVDKAGRILGPAALNLTALRSQTEFANVLAKRVNGLSTDEWHGIVVRACAIIAKQFREPSPSVVLCDVPDRDGVEYLIPGLIPRNETTILYGDGESAKSLLTLRIALSVAAGLSVPWERVIDEPIPVLILDWETNAQTVRTRLKRLCDGMGIPVPPNIHYRGDTGRGGVLRGIEDELGAIRAEVERKHIGLTVVDSIGFAVNGPLTEDATARAAVNALRQIPGTRLVVAHVSVASANQATGKVRPFGSAFFWNGMRSGIECRRSEDNPDPNAIDLGLYHRKSNDERHHKDIGLRVAFQESGCIVVNTKALGDTPDLAIRTSLSTRIYDALRVHAKTTGDIAEELNVKENEVRAIVAKMPNIVNITPGTGRGNRATWGIAGA